MRRAINCFLALAVLGPVLLLAGCEQSRELSPEEKGGNTNFMGNNPSEQPLTNAPGTQPAGVTGGGSTGGGGSAEPPGPAAQPK